MGISRFKLTSPTIHILCGGTLILLVISVLVLIVRSFAHTLARNADTIQAADFAANASPNDPLTRVRLASFLERSFDLSAIPRSLSEYEIAVSLSPHNFLYWLALGQARERDGDRPAAEKAYRRALELAPNYARTKWALGNNLARQGQTDEAFELIRGAVEQDATFAGPAAIAAMQIFDSDIGRVSTVLGESPAVGVELSKLLVNEGRFDEGLGAWERVPRDAKVSTYRDAGASIREKLIAAHRYRDAASVTASLNSKGEDVPLLGAVTNGGFESGVEARSENIFEWQIGQPYPIFGLSDNQSKEGRYSLLMRFTTPTRLDFATVSQTVAVEPGVSYELQLSYKADLNSRAEFRWEVVSLADNRRIAVSDPLVNSTGWTDVTLSFAVPADRDGIAFRLIRENCNSAACTISGNLWFDDVRLERR